MLLCTHKKYKILRREKLETILIVEDNIDIHNFIKEVLEKKQYKVLDAYSGTEALMIIEKENINLVLLDLMLPGLNGEEIIKKVKNIPIIVISAKISPEDKVNVLLNGVNDYITKPFNKDELLARIAVQLRINKNKNVSSQRSEELANLEAKRALIDKVKSLDESLDADDAVTQLKAWMAEWNGIGHVPFKEKDKVYNAFHEAVDAQFDRLKVDQRDRRIKSFRNNVNEMAGKGKGKLYSEREKLMRNYERLKNELQTYENNIGFLSVASKGGGGLIKEMERKISKLKEEMELIVKKIDTIDENLE